MNVETKSALEKTLHAVEGLREERGEILDRLESLEALRDRPGAAPRTKPEHKRFFTPNGTVYELPSTTKMQDVLPPPKAPDVSLERWLAAAVAGEHCGDHEAVEFAREQKQLLTSTSGVLVPQEYISQWIDLLRANMVLNTAGMRTVTMDAKTQVHSAVTADPGVTWHQEGGSISASNPTFAARTLTAKTLVARCQASLELAQDSPDFGSQLLNVIVGAMGAAVDQAGLFGGGTYGPAGLFGTSGVNATTGVGTVSNYSEILTGVKQLLDANVPLDAATRYAICSPATWLKYENLVTGISSDKTQLPRPRALENMRFLVTSNANSYGSPQGSVLFLGDFTNLTLGVRREASVEVIKATTYASNLLLEIVGYTRVDFVVTRPAAFATIEGI